MSDNRPPVRVPLVRPVRALPIRLAFWLLWGRRMALEGDRIYRVEGWRTALVDDREGQRKRVTFLGWPWDGGIAEWPSGKRP